MVNSIKINPLFLYYLLALWLLSACNTQQSQLQNQPSQTSVTEQKIEVTSTPTPQPQPAQLISQSLISIPYKQEIPGEELYAPANREPRPCSEIQEAALRSLEFGKLRAGPLRQWLENSSPFQGARIGEDFEWEHQGTRYEAEFRNEVLSQIRVVWSLPGQKGSLEPTSGDILRCFGAPDLYEAFYLPETHAMALTLSLWYLSEGIIVSTSQLSEETVPLSNDNIIMTFLTPGIHKEETLMGLKPWPGAWEKVVVEER